MELADKIVLIASVVTALSVIVTAIITCYKIIRKEEKWREEKDKHDKENYKAILRLVIMSPEMPLSERIEAGDVYVYKLNGNGGVKSKYLELVERFKEEHKE